MAIEDMHDSRDPLVERAVRPVGLKFIVLNKVDAGFGENANLFGRGFRRHADGRLDDRANERPIVDAREFTGAGDAELWAFVHAKECGRKSEIEESEAAES